MEFALKDGNGRDEGEINAGWEKNSLYRQGRYRSYISRLFGAKITQRNEIEP